jgi:ribosomal protein S18 acetylase RimI-like enzyme
MENVLDNPAWNALISGNKHLSFGNDHVRYFDKDVSPFAAFKENTANNFMLLYDLLPHNAPVLFVAPVETAIPAPWTILQVVRGLQMVYDASSKAYKTSIVLTPLTNEHVPQMLALTKLTNPGPFAEKTINFGHYVGVFEGEKLVAMAGQRLHPFNYAEISAVCTHPDHTGKGYAKELLLYHINRIKAASEIPYLHVRHDNDGAVKLYHKLGFYIRREVFFYAIRKSD